MSASICGADCTACSLRAQCKGCTETGGCPFGVQCLIAAAIQRGGMDAYTQLRTELLDEFHALDIAEAEQLHTLYPLHGSFVNLRYPMPGGQQVQLLDNHGTYLGNQVTAGDRCIGFIASPDFLLAASYREGGAEPELLLYKRRNPVTDR